MTHETHCAGEPIVLVVDDVAENLDVLGDVLRGAGYRVRAAISGEAALRYARLEPRPELVLLDVMMPGMDGYQTLAALRDDPRTADLPVVFVTALSDAMDEEHGLEMGAADYISKPIAPSVVLARVRTQIEAKRARDILSGRNSVLEQEVARRMAENELTQTVTIRALAHLAECRDPETGNHILRTQGYVRELAKRLRHRPRFSTVLTDYAIELLARSAPLHDIGKVGIPDAILLKPGKLTEEEWAVMRTHSELGSNAIEQAEVDVERPLEFLRFAKEIARWHHEKWDGSGYPDGLAGDAIPLSARLMAVADVFDALIHARVYKPAFSYEEAREIMQASSESHFDPEIIEAFMEGFEAFVGIAERYREPE
ncbi:MAG: two-component system response regulator [Rhodocyclaceae bacterium]|nr:two-component system response regulator [Rhodocyclaceae bacterium]